MNIENNIIGLWSEEIGSYEGTHIAFREDGTGLLSWALFERGIIDTFNWTLEEEVLSIDGTNKYTIEDMKVIRAEKSDIVLKNINIKVFKAKSENGEDIDAVEFSEPICECTNNSFWLLTKNINDCDYYTELEKAILEAASKNKSVELLPE